MWHSGCSHRRGYYIFTPAPTEVITITGKSYRLKNRAKGKIEESAEDETCQAVPA
jgi:hypothetical protein